MGVLLILGVAGLVAGGFPGSLGAAEVRVEPASIQLHVNRSQQLLVTFSGAHDTDGTHAAEFHCADTKIASVSTQGVVRALREGSTWIDVRAGGQVTQVPLVVISPGEGPRSQFVTDVVPILTRWGCNSGGCHGKASGQNGFQLSLLGFEPDRDYEALAKEARGRRLDPGDPDLSLLLLKATARMPHGGGRRLDEDSDDYRLIRDWIASGIAPPRSDDARLLRIEISPTERVLPAHARQQLLVTADFSDGTSRDVTRQAVYQVNEPEIAAISPEGQVQASARPGLVAVMARFGDQIATFHAAIPFTADETRLAEVHRQLDVLQQQLGNSRYDRLLIDQWRRLGVVPSAPADDPTFLRRAMLDICGTLPTVAEVETYLSDRRPDKRARLIDRLLDRPEYASYFALKWADILQNRGAGYSTSQQRPGTALFAGWIRDSLAANKPYDQFVTEILTASGSQRENPPTIWYRTVRKSPEYVESVAQAFLGVRIQCAQCHHHPAERWSQADYFGLAAVFSRVGRKGGFADAEVPTDESIYLLDAAPASHAGLAIRPRALGGDEFSLGPYDDPRRSLARWMTRPENPFFARTLVNRMWAHFFGRGIIHPVDDARSTNPPSNPALLDALAADFVASGYDLKQLIRVICNSYAYGLEAAPQEWNLGETQTFARFYPRRLTAEVLLDGISQVLGVPTEFSGGPGTLPPGTRAIELPDENVAAPFLDVFGRPARMSACECERGDAPGLAQALELVSSAEIHRKLTAPTGYAQQLAASGSSHADRIQELFLRALGRRPRPEELATALQLLESEPETLEAYRSLLWALLATNEFLFNH